MESDSKKKVKSGKDRQRKGNGGLNRLPNGNYEGTYNVKKKNGDSIPKSFTRSTTGEITYIKKMLQRLEPLDNDVLGIKINKTTNEITIVRETILLEDNTQLSKDMLVDKYVDYWLWNHRRKGVKRAKIVEKTFEDYVDKCKHIKRKLGTVVKNKKEYKLKVRDLTFSFIEEKMLELYDEVSEYTAVQVRNHLYNLMRFAKKDGVIETNPLQDEEIRFPESKEKKEKKYIKPVDEDRVVQYCLKKWFIDVLAQFYTGSRVSEVRGLRWNDLVELENAEIGNYGLKFDENFMSVKEFEFVDGEIKSLGRKRKYTQLKSKSSYRTIPIPDEFYKVLMIHKYLQKKLAEKLGIEFKETDPMFTTSTYNQLGKDDTNDRLKQVVEDLEIDDWDKLTSHCLRHGFCYTGLLNDVPLEYMQILLGHDDISVTREWYAHFDEKKVRKYANVVNKNRTKALKAYGVVPLAVNV